MKSISLIESLILTLCVCIYIKSSSAESIDETTTEATEAETSSLAPFIRTRISATLPIRKSGIFDTIKSSDYLFDRKDNEITFIKLAGEPEFNDVIPYSLFSFEEMRDNYINMMPFDFTDKMCGKLTRDKVCETGEVIGFPQDGILNVCMLAKKKCPNDSVIFTFKHNMQVSCQLEESELSPSKLKQIGISESNICSVKINTYEMKMNECKNPSDYFVERLSFIYINSRFDFVDTFQSKIDGRLKSINSYYCNGTKRIEECKRGACNGDLTYCKMFSCTRESKSYCSYKSRTSLVTMSINGIEVNPKCWGSAELEVSRERPIVLRVLGSTCGNCTFKCMRNGIKSSFPKEVPKLLRICKSPLCLEFMNITSNQFFRMDSRQMKTFGEFIIDMWFFGRTEKYEMKIKCDNLDGCFKECFFCEENLMDFECYGWKEYSFTLTMITVALVLTIWIKHKLTHFLFDKFRKTVKSGKENMTAKWKKGEEDIMIEKKDKSSKTKKSSGSAPFSNLIFTLMFIILAVDGCTENLSLNLDTTKCKISEGNIESCSLVHTSTLPISPIGQDTCFIIKDPSNKVLGRFILKSNSINIWCKKRVLYHVPLTKHKCMSTMRCGGTSECEENKCANFQPDDLRSEWGEANNHLGWSRCVGTAGCWVNGCFYCTEACVFYRAFFENPSMESFEVFDCSEWLSEVDLTLTFEYNGSKLKNQTRIKVRQNRGERLENMQLNLISESNPIVPDWNNCFMKNEKSLSIVKCSPPNEFVKGMVGEIQCPSKKDAQTISRKCFSEPELISGYESNNFIACRSNVLDIKHLQSNNLLPQVRDGYSIVPSNESVEMTFIGQGKFNLQMDFQNYKLESLVEDNKCDLHFISVSGCFSCSRGAQLKVSGKTDFGDAIAHVKCDCGVEFSLNLKSVLEHKNVTFSYNEPNLNCNCDVICPSSTTSFKIEGSLNSGVELFQRGMDNSVSSEISNQKGNWYDFIKDPYMWKVKLVITIILGLSTLYLLISLLLKFRK